MGMSLPPLSFSLAVLNNTYGGTSNTCNPPRAITVPISHFPLLQTE